MKQIDLARAAAEARATNTSRPATAILHDSPDVRLVVFRLAPGQSVAPHRSGSSVMLTVVSGEGFVTGGDAEVGVAAGHTVLFQPDELHGMRTDTSPCVFLATITPRPGARARASVGDASTVAPE